MHLIKSLEEEEALCCLFSWLGTYGRCIFFLYRTSTSSLLLLLNNAISRKRRRRRYRFLFLLVGLSLLIRHSSFSPFLH